MTRREMRWLGMLALLPVLSVGSLLVPDNFITGAAHAGTGIPLTADFRDAPGNQIGSDGLGPYVNGAQSVKAVFDGRGDFDLDTNTGGGANIRTLSLNLSQPASSASGCTPPFSSPTKVDAYMSTGVGGLPGLTVGQSVASTLAVHFGGWFLEFDPSLGTSTVTVTHTSTNTWTIEAASNAIALLQKATQTKGKIVLTPCGTFFMPFEVTATE
jgi:hypothetical protein